ncbi:MAG: hypothetical protein HKN19_14250 [Halioglobus sp.]|nr:hypothetical protein [Halioglobus sp.]
MSINTIERRAFFRIRDELGISYSIIENDGDESRDAHGEMELSLLSMLENVDHDLNELVNALWQENATAAQALGLLNRKVSMLAAHVLQNDGESELGYEELTASISGCGMAFESNDPVPVETRLRTSAMLKPANVRIQFSARVVSCERVSEIPATSYLLRISIDEECVEAREQLVQHVVQRQFSRRNRSGLTGR